MGIILLYKLATHNEKNVKIVTCQFVPYFISYVSTKYYLNEPFRRFAPERLDLCRFSRGL